MNAGSDELRINERDLPFQTDGGIASRAAIGVVVLATDQTLEHEFRRLLARPGVGVYQSRIWNDAAITTENLGDMEDRITDAASLILPGVSLDVVAFGCTSGSMVIGEQRVFERLRAAHPEVDCTTPITAALAAFQALDADRIALLTPYRDDLNHLIRDYVQARGVSVPVMGSFNEEDDKRAPRIDVASIREAAIELGRDKQVDAVFVSCTNLRFAAAVTDVESVLGKPVTSSNHAMAWHCLRLAGVEDRRPDLGHLFSLTL